MNLKNDPKLEYHQIPQHVRDTIDRLISALNDHNIPVQRAILFGSYACGNYHEWSDIDLAIVSEIFIGSRFDDKNKIRHIYLSISSDLEILPYRPEDFTADDPFVKEILETGTPVV